MVALLGLPARAEAPTITAATPESQSEQFLSVPLLVPVPRPRGFNPCSCVSYVQSRRPDLGTGWGTPYRYAQNHSGSQLPWVGAVVIRKEGAVWHVSYVEAVHAAVIEVSEANYENCRLTRRTLPALDGLTVGYF